MELVLEGYFQKDRKILKFDDDAINFELRKIIENDADYMGEIFFALKGNCQTSSLNKLNYEESINYYNEYVKLISELIKKLAILNNSISCSSLVHLSIYDGYFSKNKDFSFIRDNTAFLDLIGYLGLDVIYGYGCCRHLASIHEEIFKNLKLQGRSIYCLYGENYYCLPSGKFLPANHAINLLKYNENYCAFDIANYNFYLLDNQITFKSINFDGRGRYIYYSPTNDMLYKTISRDDMLTLISRFNIDSRSQNIDKKQVVEILDETKYIYQSKKSIFEDFYIDVTIPYTKKIISSMNK